MGELNSLVLVPRKAQFIYAVMVAYCMNHTMGVSLLLTEIVRLAIVYFWHHLLICTKISFQVKL